MIDLGWHWEFSKRKEINTNQYRRWSKSYNEPDNEAVVLDFGKMGADWAGAMMRNRGHQNIIVKNYFNLKFDFFLPFYFGLYEGLLLCSIIKLKFLYFLQYCNKIWMESTSFIICHCWDDDKLLLVDFVNFVDATINLSISSFCSIYWLVLCKHGKGRYISTS